MDSQATTTALPHPPLQRGSEWRKWDLHVHSPLSALNNQFPKIDGKPDWDQYIAALQKINDIAVIGITDYFLIDGYREVLRYRSEGKLPNLQLVLPNIEFRLDTLVGGRRINLHVIFSDLVGAQDIEEHFLRELKFTYEGNTQSQDERWSITKGNLEALGAKLKKEHSEFSGSDFEVGCTNATVNINELKKALDGRASIFAGNYLVCLADENLSDMKWAGQDHNIRKTLVKGCDVLLSANKSTIAWALGKKHNTLEEFIDEFGLPKPCIHGSDAHDLTRIGKPDLNRFCWIKGDPTFEGLKQLVYEPEERVFIGEEPPNPKNDYQVIDTVTITKAPYWFSYRPIPLNRDLVSVIGGRGSGKSALAELIAFGAGAETFKGSTKIEDSFLWKAARKSGTNLHPITKAAISIRWRSGEVTNVDIKDDLTHGQKEEKVRYLPQKFVESICAPENTDKLELEIERVIFQRIPKTDRMGASSLRDLRTMSSSAVQVKKQQLRNAIGKLNRSIFEAFNQRNLKDKKTEGLDRQEKELQQLIQKPPDLPEVDAGDQAEVDRLTKEKQNVESIVARYKQQLSVLDKIEARLMSFADDVRIFNEEIAELLKLVSLDGKESSFEITIPNEYRQVIATRRVELNTLISIQLDNGDNSLSALQTKIDSLRTKFKITDAKRLEYDSFQKQKQNMEDSIAALQNDIRQIETVLEPALARDREKRLDLYLDYFVLLLEEKAALDKLYEPLHAALRQGTETDKKLEFESKITFDVIAHAPKAFDFIDTRRRTRYKTKDALAAALVKVISKIEESNYDREATRNEIQSFRKSFLQDSEGHEITISDQLRSNKTEEDFNNWFFDVEPFTVKYSMKFDKKDLTLLSPGQKGIVLLLVYLEVDQEDRRPLIIDQPEDNLDNRSIYSNLVQYFRKRKKGRQIIIITHNPNLVVNTDSEQVVVAEFDGQREPRIVYTCGALENTSGSVVKPGIREHVCSVLEGGSEAFRKREEKYSLPER